ncbi:MAG: hypothetical protein K5893_03810 [Prevotella sp.]|nr:hypothetical protein [Prevotella sp.]
MNIHHSPITSALAKFVLCALLCLSSARANAIEPFTSDSLKCCDLLFVSPTSGNAITDVTQGFDQLPIDHVAIYYMIDDEKKVIEATPDGGVQMLTLKDFLEQNTACQVFVGRVLAEFSETQTLKNALQYVGRPYDHLFLSTNDAIYCSELVQFSFVDHQGKRIFKPIPMSFHDKNGHITDYWLNFYKNQGMEVPEGQPGTNPGELSRRETIAILFRLQ